MINWGIIGAGKIAHRFCQALKKDTRAQLYAVSCRTLNKAQIFQEQHPCFKIYDDYQALLNDEAIDAIYIALPHYYHFEWVKKALLAKKAVLVEKPATINQNQMEEIKVIAQEESVLFMEAMKTRFIPGYLEAKKLIDAKVIGNLEKINTSFCSEAKYEASCYLFDPKQGGGLLDVGIYNISYLVDFFKTPIENITVTCNLDMAGIDHYLKATVTYPKYSGIIECAIDRSSSKKAVFQGTLGKLILTPLHRPLDIEIILNDGNVIKKHVPYEYDDFYGEIKHFNDLLEKGKLESDIMTLDDSVACARIISKIQEVINYENICYNR